MKFLLALVLGVAGACLLAPTAANAQATRTWVSGLGDDANPCSRTAPCKTFPGAYSKTAVAGEIDCIDPGGFGALTIGHSIAVKCDYDAEAGVLVSGTNGFVVAAGASDIVWISGIDFEGLGAASQNLSLNGIKILSAGMVTVSDCTIRGFTNTNGTDGNGIFLNNTGTTKLFVDNTLIGDNSNVAVEVRPQAGATGNAEIFNTRATNNLTGYRANGTSNSASVQVDVLNSVASFNGGAAVSSASGTGPASVMVNHSTLSFNNVALSGGGSATSMIHVGYSTITGNNAVFASSGGAQIFTYGNNEIDGNVNPALPGPAPLH